MAGTVTLREITPAIKSPGRPPVRFQVAKPTSGDLEEGGAFSDPRSTGCGDPGWSPDGTKIVFTRGSPNGPHIYTVNADGRSDERVETERPSGKERDDRSLLTHHPADERVHADEEQELGEVGSNAQAPRDPAITPPFGREK